MRFFFLLFCVFLFPAWGIANLGESRKELTERYGRPFESRKVNDIRQLFFKKDEFVIFYCLMDGKAEAVAYKKIGGTIDEVETRTLLEKNSQGKGFVLMGERNGKRMYKEEESGRKALLDGETKGQTLTITTEKGETALVEISVEQTSERLKDF